MTTPPSQGTAGVVGGNRTPFAKAGGHYAGASNLDMLTETSDALIARFGLAGAELGEVRAGAVLSHSKDFNLAREAVLGTALDPRTPAVTIQRACATSIEAAWDIANKISLGQIDSGIAAGAGLAQAGIESVLPGWGAGFVAAALFFFAFTTIMAYYYMAENNITYINGHKVHPLATQALLL